MEDLLWLRHERESLERAVEGSPRWGSRGSALVARRQFVEDLNSRIQSVGS